MQTGKFPGRFFDQAFGKNEATGNRYIMIAFQAVGGRFDGETIRMTKALTEKTAEQLRSVYSACGWDLRQLPPPQSQLTRIVSLAVQETEFTIVNKDGARVKRKGLEVAFVRPLVEVNNELDAIGESGFFNDLFVERWPACDRADRRGRRVRSGHRRSLRERRRRRRLRRRGVAVMTAKKKPREKKPSLQTAVPKVAAEVIHTGKCYICKAPIPLVGSFAVTRSARAVRGSARAAFFLSRTKRAPISARIEASRAEIEARREIARKTGESETRSMRSMLVKLEEQLEDLANTSAHMGDVSRLGNQETAASFLSGGVRGLRLAVRVIKKKLGDLD